MAHSACKFGVKCITYVGVLPRLVSAETDYVNYTSNKSIIRKIIKIACEVVMASKWLLNSCELHKEVIKCLGKKHFYLLFQSIIFMLKVCRDNRKIQDVETFTVILCVNMVLPLPF